MTKVGTGLIPWAGLGQILGVMLMGFLMDSWWVYLSIALVCRDLSSSIIIGFFMIDVTTLAFTFTSIVLLLKYFCVD